MNRAQRRAEWRARRAGSARGNPHLSVDSHGVRAIPPLSSRDGARTPSAVNLHVGELLLHGFERGHARRIADALQRSLTAMLSSRGIPDSWSRSSRIGRADGGTLQLTREASPRAIGEGIARHVLEHRTERRS
jgi:hypothetical protein